MGILLQCSAGLISSGRYWDRTSDPLLDFQGPQLELRPLAHRQRRVAIEGVGSSFCADEQIWFSVGVQIADAIVNVSDGVIG